MTNRPLHVGYVLKRFPRLSETFILNELLELERQGTRVTVFSLLRPPEEPRHELLGELRAEIIYLPCSSTLVSWKVRSARAKGLERQNVAALLDGTREPFFSGKTPEEVATLLLRATTVAGLAMARDIDHLHAHFGSDATTVALLSARLARRGYSFTAHARDIFHLYVDPQSDLAMRRAKLTEADFALTVSDYNLRHLQGISGDQARIRRLYNGIDLQRFVMSTTGRAECRFLSVGRLVGKKGTDTTLRAIAALRDLGLAATLRIVGDGPERARLDALVEELRIADRVEFLGAQAQERVRAEMATATAIVLPCRIEPSGDRDALPTVLLEALASSLPAITSDLLGLPEIVGHERTGLLVPADDPQALALAMERLVREPGLAQRMAVQGREHAERHFDLRRNVGELRCLFTNAIEARAAARQGPGTHSTHEEDRDAHRIPVS